MLACVAAERTEDAHSERVLKSRREAGPRGTRAIEALLEAALAEFGARGWRDTTVENVLRAAGVSRATFYRYFADLRDVLHVLARRYIDEVTPIMEKLYAQALSDSDLRDTAVDEYVSIYSRYSGIARIWAEEAPQDRTLMLMARRSSEWPRRSFRATFPAHAELDADATFLVIYALTDRFPYHAFGTGSPRQGVVDRDAVAATIKVMLDGVARAHQLLASRESS
ncbi:hypothetical protein A5695_15440 [Mycobacterium sp. E1747]|nr:hypothetical protein A5695_15440 [Mycobacterium sp. E1747]